METHQQITAPDSSSAVQDAPKRKAYLTAEQKRVVDTLAEYEKAYISQSSKQGHYLTLNGDKTEHIRTNTLTALIKKGYLEPNGTNRWKLAE